MNNQAQLLPGTLDLLILRAVSLGPLHGYGILLHIGQRASFAHRVRRPRTLQRVIAPSNRVLNPLGERLLGRNKIRSMRSI
jgi:hypothetical protein